MAQKIMLAYWTSIQKKNGKTAEQNVIGDQSKTNSEKGHQSIWHCSPVTFEPTDLKGDGIASI